MRFLTCRWWRITRTTAQNSHCQLPSATTRQSGESLKSAEGCHCRVVTGEWVHVPTASTQQQQWVHRFRQWWRRGAELWRAPAKRAAEPSSPKS